MKLPGHASTIIALIILAVSSGNVQAWAWDWLTLYPTDIEAIIRFDGTDRRNSNGNDSLDYQVEGGVHISQEGHILDPAIARFLLDVEPVYAWGKFDSTTQEEDRNGNFLSYLFRLSLLHGTPGPFSFNMSALRSNNLNTGSLGSRYESVIENKSAQILWKNPAFPMNLVYEERALFQDFLTGQTNAVSKRDELVKTLTVRGRSSKLSMLVEHQSLDDRIPERDQDFEVDRAYLTHNLPWGHDSQLRSRIDYYDRTGFNANERLTIEEIARIQHTDNVFSRSSYRFFSVTQFVETNEHVGEFEIFHQLYDNLTTSVHMFGSSLSSNPIDETRWRGGLESQYNKSDLFGAQINTGFRVSYQETDRDSSLGFIEVIDEPHVVTLGGAIILNRRFVITPTIIITDADGSQVYIEGFDYIVLQLTDDLTQIQTIPGGQISIGETILVSYKALALPSQEFSTTYTKFNLDINLGWVRFSHYARESNDKLLSGAGESFLNDNKDVVTEIEFRWKMADIDALLGAERRFSEIGNFESTSYTFQQLFTWASSEGTLWNLNFIESFTETDTLDTDLYNLELSANWQPFIGLSVRPILGAWKRLDTGTAITDGRRDDQFITAGLTMRWLYRKVAFDLGYHHNRRTTDERQTNEDRLMFNLSRRF